LTGLNLTDCKVTDNVLTYVAQHCTSLETLCLKGCKLLTGVPVVQDSSQTEKNILAALHGTETFLAKSNSISIGDLSFASSGLLSKQLKTSVAVDTKRVTKPKSTGFISACPIKSLELASCPMIESKAIGQLEIFEALRSLDVSGTFFFLYVPVSVVCNSRCSGVNKLMDEDLSRVLTSCLQLETLNLSNCILLTSNSVILCSKLEYDCTLLIALISSNASGKEIEITLRFQLQGFG